jgi:gliding motility-associated-like protein
VNDAPSFTRGSDVTVDEDAGQQDVSGWATSVSPGSANESTQILSFTVTNDNNGLFISQPSIDVSGKLTFTPSADKNGIATITVILTDDGETANGGIDESSSETFTITIDPVNDAPSFTKGGDVAVDEDGVTQTINGWATAISAGPADESSQVLSFTVTNDNNSLFDSQPLIDASGNLTFTPVADKSGTATVTVILTDDGGTANGGIDESSSEIFTITIDPINDAPSFIKGGEVIIDEDAGAQTINGWATAIFAGPADESSQVLSFTVTNDNNSLFDSQPSIDASGNLTFTTAADKSGTVTVTVILTDDGGTANGGIDESTSETFTITIDPVNDAPSFTKGGDVAVDEDGVTQTINGWATAISAGPADESSQVVAFTVSNDDNSLFSFQPSIDASGNLTFIPAANKSGTATVTVKVNDDGGTANGGTDEGATETFTITIESVNDAPSFTNGSNTSIDEDAGLQTITGWATDISLGPFSELSQQISFQLNNDNPALFSVQPVINPSGDLTFTSAADAFGAASVTVTLTDDGGTLNGGTNSSEQTFTITVNPVNDAPFFVKGSDVIVNEDAAPQTINAWASGISAGEGETAQTLNFHVSNDNNDLFSTQPSVNASGDLSFSVSPDVSGVATVTLSLQDSGGTDNSGADQSDEQTFTITVNAVNDAPSFTKGSDVIVNENEAAQTIQSWASGISAGPGESAQILNFMVSNNNNTLFTTQPSVNASGDLSFTPASGASGVDIVTISLHDNGGTAYGGMDQSDEQTFTITINSINHAPVFTAGGNVIVNEDAAPYREPWATAISAEDPGQTLTFIVAAENQALFTVQPAIDASGTLSFELRPDVFGSSAVTVQLKDNGLTANGGIDQSAAGTFTITVYPVNDEPRIDPVSNVTFPINSEPVVVNLTGIHPGPGEERQQLSIEVLSDNPSILPAPQLTTVLNGTASLVLSPLSGATGAATVTIKITDNGGTGFGGQNETLMAFTVLVEEEVQAIFLPNFFSPEDNGVNDVFRVRGAGIEEIRFSVYTISGEEIFSATDIITATETGWDGKYKGKDLPAGIYTWTLQGWYIDGKPLTSKNNQYGQVVLMR